MSFIKKMTFFRIKSLHGWRTYLNTSLALVNKRLIFKGSGPVKDLAALAAINLAKVSLYLKKTRTDTSFWARYTWVETKS